MIFIIHRSWEYVRGTLLGTFPGNFAHGRVPKGPRKGSQKVPTNMLVGHVGRTFSGDLSGDLWEPFREAFRVPSGTFPGLRFCYYKLQIEGLLLVVVFFVWGSAFPYKIPENPGKIAGLGSGMLMGGWDSPSARCKAPKRKPRQAEDANNPKRKMQTTRAEDANHPSGMIFQFMFSGRYWSHSWLQANKATN